MKTIVPASGDYWLLTYRNHYPDNAQEVGKWQVIAQLGHRTLPTPPTLPTLTKLAEVLS